jgi:hypothetical protein
MYNAQFLPHIASIEEQRKYESRVALALNIDPAKRLLESHNVWSLLESTPAPSSHNYERYSPLAWKDNAWRRAERNICKYKLIFLLKRDDAWLWLLAEQCVLTPSRKPPIKSDRVQRPGSHAAHCSKNTCCYIQSHITSITSQLLRGYDCLERVLSHYTALAYNSKLTLQLYTRDHGDAKGE